MEVMEAECQTLPAQSTMLFKNVNTHFVFLLNLLFFFSF